jgi:hypothetical protein
VVDDLKAFNHDRAVPKDLQVPRPLRHSGLSDDLRLPSAIPSGPAFEYTSPIRLRACEAMPLAVDPSTTQCRCRRGHEGSVSGIST